MRKIFDQMEQLRRMTESPVQKMIEHQERMLRLTEPPIQKMIRQQNEHLPRIAEPFCEIAEKTAGVLAT